MKRDSSSESCIFHSDELIGLEDTDNFEKSSSSEHLLENSQNGLPDFRWQFYVPEDERGSVHGEREAMGAHQFEDLYRAHGGEVGFNEQRMIMASDLPHAHALPTQPDEEIKESATQTTEGKNHGLEIIQENNSELSNSNSNSAKSGRKSLLDKSDSRVHRKIIKREVTKDLLSRPEESGPKKIGSFNKVTIQTKREEIIQGSLKRREDNTNQINFIICNPLSTNNVSMKGTKTTQALSHSCQTTVEYNTNYTAEPRKLSDKFHSAFGIRYTKLGYPPAIKLNKRLEPAYIVQLAEDCRGDDRLTLSKAGIIFGAGLIGNYLYALEQCSIPFTRSRNKHLLRSASSSAIGLSTSRGVKLHFPASGELSQKGLLKIKRKNIIPIEGVESQVVVRAKIPAARSQIVKNQFI